MDRAKFLQFTCSFAQVLFNPTYFYSLRTVKSLSAAQQKTSTPSTCGNRTSGFRRPPLKPSANYVTAETSLHAQFISGHNQGVLNLCDAVIGWLLLLENLL